MNWFKENPVPAGILGAGLLAAAAFLFLALQASSRETAASEALASETARIQLLQRRQPPPDDDGLRQAKSDLLEYETELSKLATTLAAMEEPLEDISPESFQDKIRFAANAVSSLAVSKKTTLPESFLLGFEEFQSQLPPSARTPVLYREFKVVNRLVNTLLELGIEKIDLLERGRSGKETMPAEPASESDPAIPRLVVHPFRLSFTAQQEKVIQALNLIPAESQFLVIRSLLLENTAPEPPSRKAPEDQSPSPSPALDILLPGETPQEKLDIVFGRESVKATLELELLDFPDPPAAPAPPSPTPATPATPATN